MGTAEVKDVVAMSERELLEELVSEVRSLKLQLADAGKAIAGNKMLATLTGSLGGILGGKL